MISRCSSRFRNTWPKRRAGLLALAACALAGCAGERVAPGEPSAPPPAVVDSRARGLSDQFQWAVQDYEAGKYTEAAEKFSRLEPRGAETPEFDLVSFYLGMCYYRAGQYGLATSRLREFLRGERSGEMAQDARLALLTIYERTQRWDDLLGLAAETDPLPLFQDNRAFLKLLWARALEAKGERKGAKKVLDDALQYLAGDPNAAARSPDPDQDLWGRYHYTKLVLDLGACGLTEPKAFAEGKKSVRRLYPAWLDSSVDCLRGSLGFLEKELLLRDSAWGKAGTQAFVKETERFGDRIKGYYAEEKNNLARQRTLQNSSRTNLYRLISALEESSGRLKAAGFSPTAFEALRKRIDLLLVSLSSPA